MFYRNLVNLSLVGWFSLLSKIIGSQNSLIDPRRKQPVDVHRQMLVRARDPQPEWHFSAAQYLRSFPAKRNWGSTVCLILMYHRSSAPESIFIG